MKNILITLALSLLTLSCKDKKEETPVKLEETTVITKVNKEELKYVVNESFPVGDVRRYGIRVEGGDPKHKVSNKNTTQTIFDLAEKENIKLFFPKGFYNFGLYLKGRQNIEITFDDASFSGPLYIIENEEKKKSSNITLKGKLTTYFKTFIRNSKEIEIEKLNIVTDVDKNSAKLRSMGCDIYVGSEDIYISQLYIDDLGSGNESYANSRAALQVHGWNNNPKNLVIDKVHIKSSDKHGIYLTGEDHLINKVIIDKFGTGSIKETRDLDDSKKGETQNVTGLWLNKCNNSTINSVEINTQNSKGKYAVWLDSGITAKQSIIELLTLKGGDNKLPIYAQEDTNVLVKSVEK